jgi:sugar-phosphatase
MIQIECDAILFDLDGVLIDSTECITRHWKQWAQQHGVDLALIMQVAHGMRTIETIRLVAPHLSAEEEASRFAKNEIVDTDGVTSMPGASTLLTGLPTGAWSIVTAGTRDVAAARLNRAGLPIPATLITADDVSRGKPNPESYLVAARKLGMSPDKCAVVEDSPAGLEAARSAGMQAIAVATTHATEDLMRANAIADRLSDIQVKRGRGCLLAIQIGA